MDVTESRMNVTETNEKSQILSGFAALFPGV